MDNFSTLKEKIIAFLTETGTRKIDFYNAVGIQSSNFKGTNLKSAPGGDMLVKILTLYPELSAEWLMRGAGDMLLKTPCQCRHDIPNSDVKIEHGAPSESNIESVIEKFTDRIAAQAEEIGRLRERVAHLEQMLGKTATAASSGHTADVG